MQNFGRVLCFSKDSQKATYSNRKASEISSRNVYSLLEVPDYSEFTWKSDHTYKVLRGKIQNT